MKINCLIIDDEPSSQIVLKTFIDRIDFLSLSNVCNNAIEALSILNTDASIDLLFLDINMPKISGLEFYKSLKNPPLVIFTTAYPQYAVDGFEVNAIDYLLKPFSFDRFLSGVNKVQEVLKQTNIAQKTDDFIFIKADKKLHKINTSHIRYIEAFGDYVKIHTSEKFLLTNNRFKNILHLLDEATFIQVHKSFAVNIQLVSVIDGNQLLIEDTKIPIGLTYKTAFLEKFKNT